MHGRGVGGDHRSLTAVTPARPVAREMPHHLKRLAVARRAPLKHPKTAEEGDGAHNVICFKQTNKIKSNRLERLFQKEMHWGHLDLKIARIEEVIEIKESIMKCSV